MDLPLVPSEDDRAFALKHDLRYEAHIETLHKDEGLLGKFRRIGLDSTARAFMEECFHTYNSKVHTIKWRLLRPVASLLYTHTDLNAMLNTGQMHLLSTTQLRALFEAEIKAGGGRLGRYLDIGAGCGRITKAFAPLFDSVYATEVAPKMIARLEAQGFTAVQTCDLDADLGEEKFDMVSLLNVIDRCDKPVTLLQQAARRLKSPDSWLVIATPLPLRPSVETATGWKTPTESIIDMKNCACCAAPRCCVWEASVRQVVAEYFAPNGFVLKSVSRIPYISQGDSVKPYYVLDDALFVLQKAPSDAMVSSPPAAAATKADDVHVHRHAGH